MTMLRMQVVGHTTDTNAKVLAAFDGTAPGIARLAYDNGGKIHAIDTPLIGAPPYTLATFALTGLTNAAPVRYAITSGTSAAALPDAATILAGPTHVFRLLPMHRPLRIALVSCNDIFDSSVTPRERRGALWRTLAAEIASGNVDLIIHSGDQIYGDEAPDSWTRSEPRVAAYRRHYVETWSHPDVAAALATCPSMMMWDDHEIYDGWGSNDGDISPPARQRFADAEAAFVEFQAALNPTPFDGSSHAWSFVMNGIGVLAVDARKHRSWHDRRILGGDQFAALDRELAALADAKLRHLFVVVGTPPVYLKTMIAEKLLPYVSPSSVDDIRDGWTASRNQSDCRRLLMMLLDFSARSGTQVTILGGDIHVATLAHIDTRIGFGPNRKHPRIYQVTSSGIARPPPKQLEAIALRLIAGGGAQNLFNEDIRGALRPIAGADAHVLTKRNFAILKTCDASGGAWDPNGNLWVELFAELDDGIRKLEQQLPRTHH
jgi:hypothetical protein